MLLNEALSRLDTPAASPALGEWIKKQLSPYVAAIDLEGFYPESFLRALGARGGYAGVVESAYGGSDKGLVDTIEVISKVSEVCLSTAFAVWCQTACARYIQLSANEALKSALLPALASGALLGGTGLSNTMKSCCEIERFLLTATRVEGGYEINGTLPWVSNLGEEHIFVTGCPVENEGGLVFFVVRCNQPGFKLVEGAHFTALEGTRTFACQFRHVLIGDESVLAHPGQSGAYLARIRPGMILAQLGMGLGLIRDCIRLVESSGRTHAHINCFEEEQAEALHAALTQAEEEAVALARILDGQPEQKELAALLPRILRIRLAGGELSLRAAQAAMLHQGARGYLRTAVAQRRLREAYFVAIVTPSLKHLRYELARRKLLPSEKD